MLSGWEIVVICIAAMVVGLMTVGAEHQEFWLMGLLLAVAVAVLAVVLVARQRHRFTELSDPEPWRCPRCGGDKFTEVDYGLAYRCSACGRANYLDAYPDGEPY